MQTHGASGTDEESGTEVVEEVEEKYEMKKKRGMHLILSKEFVVTHWNKENFILNNKDRQKLNRFWVHRLIAKNSCSGSLMPVHCRLL